ncbi:recombinase RecA [candidate division KSB1 bacterium]|nr:recombinase RecA [candidate division KSB1 bacterium]
MDKEKQKNLEVTLQQIDKQYGKGSIMRLGDSGPIQRVDVISTGALSLDWALGVGGVPRGRVVEIYGPEASGKTTLALTIIANAQKNGGNAAIIDAEHALDPTYAKALNVDIDQLLVSQPDTGEQALEICEMLIRSSAVDVVVIDSVAALVPKAEIEGEMGDSLPGLQARLMSQALRKLTAVVARSNTTLIFINQLRMKIGVMFGNPETTTGGNALKFYSSVRLEIRRVQSIKDGDKIVGNRTRVKVVKNKLSAPFRESEFDIIYGRGIDRVGDVLDLASQVGVVTKSGTWYSYGDERLGQGRDRVVEYLNEHTDLLEKIELGTQRELGFEPEAKPAATNGAEPVETKTKGKKASV